MISAQRKFRVKIFADGADMRSMVEMYHDPLISGFTTNPTLMRKAGVREYRTFAREVLEVIKDKPISFEVFSDDFGEMERQAKEIASWGKNVTVKIPVTNTKAKSSVELIAELSKANVRINVTAMMTLEQVMGVVPALVDGPGGVCVGICRKDCRFRKGPSADHGRDRRLSQTLSKNRTDLG